jgi:hypothetical protein
MAKNVKDKQARSAECDDVKRKLSELGLTPEMEGVDRLYVLLRDFEEQGYGATERIKLHGLKRVAVIRLSVGVRNTSCVQLNYDASV